MYKVNLAWILCTCMYILGCDVGAYAAFRKGGGGGGGGGGVEFCCIVDLSITNCVFSFVR